MKSIIISKPSGLNGREWVDSHNYIKNLQTMIERIENDDKLSPKNKETITQFVASNSRLSTATLLKNAQVVYAFLKEMNKDIDQITQEDCKNYYIELMSSQRKAWTLRKYVSVLKRFFRWKYGLGKEEAVPLLKTWTSSFSVKKW
ncbi:MAG: site-specific integrase, partial [Candidatus Diapherotrites archaeon]|nr:site-specific integrase [Candidatus Diapherotrites archaeon]